MSTAQNMKRNQIYSAWWWLALCLSLITHHSSLAQDRPLKPTAYTQGLVNNNPDAASARAYLGVGGSSGGSFTNGNYVGGTFTTTTNSAVRNTDLSVSGLVFPNAQGYLTNWTKLVHTNIGGATLLGVGTATPTAELEVNSTGTSFPSIIIATNAGGNLARFGRASANFTGAAGTDLGIFFPNSLYVGRATTPALSIDTTSFGVTTIYRLKVSSVGSTITNIVTATVSFNPNVVTLTSYTQVNLTITGAKDGDRAIVAAPAGLNEGLFCTAKVTAADTVTIYVRNPNATNVTDNTSRTLGVALLQF
jgi:hypothetical protein